MLRKAAPTRRIKKSSDLLSRQTENQASAFKKSQNAENQRRVAAVFTNAGLKGRNPAQDAYAYEMAMIDSLTKMRIHTAMVRADRQRKERQDQLGRTNAALPAAIARHESGPKGVDASDEGA